MDADTLGDALIRRAEDGEGDVLRATGAPTRSYDTRRLLADARKTGNFLRHLGVVRGRVVAVADDPVPEVVLSLFGATLLGSATRFVTLGSPEETAPDTERIDARVLVAPPESIEAYALPAGGKRVVYGDPPTDPAIAHFERDVWSENASFASTEVATSDTALRTERAGFSHSTLLRAAEGVVRRTGMNADNEIAVRAPLTDPGTVVAGVLAPVLAGGTILLPDAETVGDVAVTVAADAPEKTVVETTTVL